MIVGGKNTNKEMYEDDKRLTAIVPIMALFHEGQDVSGNSS